MWKIALLILILLFVLWSLYNINTEEGFQASGTAPAPNCDVLINSYKSLEERYNKAVADKNEIILTSAGPALNLMKNSLINMNCPLPLS